MMLDTMARVRELLDARGLTMYQLSVISDVPDDVPAVGNQRCPLLHAEIDGEPRRPAERGHDFQNLPRAADHHERIL